VKDENKKVIRNEQKKDINNHRGHRESGE